MPEYLSVVGPKLSLSVELSLNQNSGCVSGTAQPSYDCAIIAACGGNRGWTKVNTKHVQRRIAELDAQYTVAQLNAWSCLSFSQSLPWPRRRTPIEMLLKHLFERPGGGALLG